MGLTVSHASFGDEGIESTAGSEIVADPGRQGLYLIFKGGPLPKTSDIRSAVARIGDAHLLVDPVVVEDLGSALNDRRAEGGMHSIAVQQISRNGLTFDLTTAEGGDQGLISQLLSFHDCEPDLESSITGLIQLRPGSHIVAGANSLPIMRSFMELARDLMLQIDTAEVVIWPPARSAIGRRYFDSCVTAWLQQGTFPPLGLVGFYPLGDDQFSSIGLSHFIGQELRIDAALMDDPASPSSLSSRLINQLILSGAVEQTQAIVAPDGRRLTLTPSKGGTHILVQPG